MKDNYNNIRFYSKKQRGRPMAPPCLLLRVAQPFSSDGVMVFRHFLDEHNNALFFRPGCLYNGVGHFFHQRFLLLIRAAGEHFDRYVRHGCPPHFPVECCRAYYTMEP